MANVSYDKSVVMCQNFALLLGIKKLTTGELMQLKTGVVLPNNRDLVIISQDVRVLAIEDQRKILLGRTVLAAIKRITSLC